MRAHFQIQKWQGLVKSLLENLDQHVAEAVSFFWTTRSSQSEKQTLSGKRDQGSRGAVTGGAQMSGFVRLLTDVIVEAGIDPSRIFYNRCLELPGFFRPTKQWDLLVVQDEQLLVAMEAKSHVGPSFGNNFNNRTEEAIGSALDLWTAYREGAFNKTVRPWLGYVFLLEDCPKSRCSVRVYQPHFKVFPEFINASYAKRYELLCRKLVRERHYDASAFLISQRDSGSEGRYEQPASDLTFETYARSLFAYVRAHTA